LHVPFGHAAEWPADLDRLRRAGFILAGLTPRDDATDIASFAANLPAGQPVAVLAGSEGDGLSAAALEACDLSLRISMAPGVDSLNVATATGIALHRLA
jgi:tRNA G18 (ribose-2'-O)-methylase SpoU